MISLNLKNTMFILGAGAHVPYEYPTARQLRDKIKNFFEYLTEIDQSIDFEIKPDVENDGHLYLLYRMLMNTDDQWDYWKACHGSRENINVNPGWVSKKFVEEIFSFLDRFIASGVLTLDSFATKKASHEFDQIYSRLMIVVFMYYYEKSFENSGKQDWIEEFFIDKIIRKNQGFFIEYSPRIITFNYDCLFERKINNAFKELYNVFPELKITHVYGKIPITSHYSLLSDERLILSTRNSIQDIKFVGETSKIHDQFISLLVEGQDQAHDVTDIVFLGFGFDEDNLKTLFKNFNGVEENKSLEKIKFYSTNVGLKSFDITIIKKILPPGCIIEFFEDELGIIDCSKILHEKLDIHI
ncbi:MAG: hypothetical protein KDD46_05440 [Bdellovibrionales bacterium]|nr:hypothetical protein [Bdellovibrionales bacterium]